MAEMLPLKTSCISVSISFVRRRDTEFTLGLEYGTTVTLFVTEAV